MVTWLAESDALTDLPLWYATLLGEGIYKEEEVDT
jgi:hypothetical protein